MANKVLLQRKYTRIIEEFAKLAGLSVKEALDFFYQSEVYEEISQGISDMHCRSDKYLAEELMDEMKKNIEEHCKT